MIWDLSHVCNYYVCIVGGNNLENFKHCLNENHEMGSPQLFPLYREILQSLPTQYFLPKHLQYIPTPQGGNSIGLLRLPKDGRQRKVG